MINGTFGFYVLLGTLFLGMFAILQIVVWCRNRVILGASPRFAQYVIGTSVVLVGATMMCQALLTSKVPIFSGMLSVIPNTLTTLASWIIPAFLMLETIVVTECVLTDRTAVGAWQWHLSALMICMVWMIMLVYSPALG